VSEPGQPSPEPAKPRAEPAPHIPPAYPSSTTLPGLKELEERLSEIFRIKDTGVTAVVGFRLPLAFCLAYRALKNRQKDSLRDLVARAIALTFLGEIDISEAPTLVVVRKVAPTINVYEVEAPEIEERLRLYEKLVEELKKDVKVYKELVSRYEEKLKSYERELEELRNKPASPEVAQYKAQLKRAVELLRKSLDPRYRNSPEYTAEVTKFLASFGG